MRSLLKSTLVAVLGLWLAFPGAGRLQAGDSPPSDAKPAPSPTPDLEPNPKVRVTQTFQVPTKLRLGVLNRQAFYGLAPAPLEKITLKVGSNMTVGAEYKVYIYPEGQPRPEYGEIGSGLCKVEALGEWTGYRSGRSLSPRGRKSVVEVVITIFETDLPSDGTADPYSKRYKELWTRTLKETVE